MMKRGTRIKPLSVLSFLAACAIAIQFLPVETSNPPVTGGINAPDEVRAILERSCFDCHSNETRWPWYGRIAPVSWLMAHDVSEGREHLNFSEWNRLDPPEQAEAIHEVWEEVEEGEMPLWFYLPMHPEARLDDRDRMLLRSWATSRGKDEERRE